MNNESSTIRLHRYIKGELSATEKDALEKDLLSSADLRQELDNLKGVFAPLSDLRRQDSTLPKNFSDEVMRSIRNASEIEERPFNFAPFIPLYFVRTAAISLIVLIMTYSAYRGYFLSPIEFSSSGIDSGTSVSGPDSNPDTSGALGSQNTIKYDDTRIKASTDIMLTYMKGSVGALLMLVFGLSAIVISIVAGIDQNRKLWLASGLLLLFSIVSFILRAAISAL